MPLFMDVHHKAPEGAKAKDVADAHMADLKTQDKYGVKYINYWFDEKQGKIFCLVDAPNAEAANISGRPGSIQSRVGHSPNSIWRPPLM